MMEDGDDDHYEKLWPSKRLDTSILDISLFHNVRNLEFWADKGAVVPQYELQFYRDLSPQIKFLNIYTELEDIFDVEQNLWGKQVIEQCDFSNVVIIEDNCYRFPEVDLQDNFPNLACIATNKTYELSRVFQGVKTLLLHCDTEESELDLLDAFDPEKIPDLEHLMLQFIAYPTALTAEEVEEFVEQNWKQIIDDFTNAFLPRKIRVEYI